MKKQYKCEVFVESPGRVCRLINDWLFRQGEDFEICKIIQRDDAFYIFYSIPWVEPGPSVGGW